MSTISTASHSLRVAPALDNEINVTPMVDVQLPDPSAHPPMEGPSSIVLELDAAGRYSINESAFPHEELAARLHAIYDTRPEKVLFVKGDGKLKYAQIVAAMDVARGAGVKVLGIP